MKKFLSVLLLVGAFTIVAGAVEAQESAFLSSLQGKWAGKGTVRIRTNSIPVTVSCRFDSQSTGSSLSLDGNCRGMIVMSRTIGADLSFNGANYTGSYTGAGTGTAGLTGSRNGNAINLAIHWAKQVNGDRSAQMALEKIGSNGMKLTTIDVDPVSGKNVVTSEINLLRQ